MSRSYRLRQTQTPVFFFSRCFTYHRVNHRIGREILRCGMCRCAQKKKENVIRSIEEKTRNVGCRSCDYARDARTEKETEREREGERERIICFFVGTQ